MKVLKEIAMALAAKKKERTSGGVDRKPSGGTLRRDDAVAQIRQLIEDLGLKPGDRLPAERQLAERFSLSRGTVREALQFLAALNFVESRHGGGCFVRATAEEANRLRTGWLDWVSTHRGRILETLEVRLGCEVFAARLASRRAGPDELARLVEVLRAMKTASETRDVPAFVQSDLAFHAGLLKAAGNKTLEDLVGALGRELIPERAAIADIAGRTARSFAEHHAIYAAVQSGDADAAAQAMNDHLESVRHDVLVNLLGDAELSAERTSAAANTAGDKPTELT